MSKGSYKGKNQAVVERFREYFEEISECLNFEKLGPFLCEKAALFTLKEGQDLFCQTPDSGNAIHLLLRKLKQNPSLYSTLLDCLQREKQHLGHVYITALLEGRQYASEEEIAYSRALKNAVVGRLTDFMAGINITALVPHMFERQLLTDDERECISDTQLSNNRRIMRLFHILDTKGPMAYSHFANCLKYEHSHQTHVKLYKMMCEDVEVSQTKALCSRGSIRKPSIPEDEMPLFKKPSDRSLTLHGSLKGKEYERLMATFQSYHHNGKWTELEAEAKKYREKKGISCELQVVVLLESAVASLFQKKEEITISLVSEAQELCKKIQGDNSTFLEGRCMYILSRLYRYLKQYDKAKECANNAKQILFIVEPGEDSAFAKYCYACVLVESDTSDAKDIENYFRFAIADANSHNSGLDLVAPHSYMRLAQLYLGSKHYNAGSISDKTSIRNAESCLRKVDPNSLSLRSGCHFQLIESDLYLSKSMFVESKKTAQCALDVAQRYNFTNEIESATNRLESAC